VEIWYPAIIPAGTEELTVYTDTLGRADVPDSLRPFEFEGRAVRDAAADRSGEPYPLVIISHGYPGSRLMMTYLAENLASKGYVVVSIDHKESTFGDVSNFGSTLLNRNKDQRFIIDMMVAENSGSDFLAGLVDAENTGLIGYSMGGYGALNTIGAGYNAVLTNFLGPVADSVLASSENYAGADPRVKAAVLFAPWGGNLAAVGAPGVGLWDAEALANISIPTLWVVGSQDDVSLFSGVVGLFDNATNSERYLLTYDNALHNVAPNPPPVEATELGDYQRYADPVWDERHMNNVNQHFVSAFLGQVLRGEDQSAVLEPQVEDANEGVYSVDDAGNFTETHTYWAGFAPRTALGLSLCAVKP
jgi:pimeloyl-ACP methyl ester carboxylesterase